MGAAVPTPCLVTNDDGIDSEGLRALAAVAARCDLDVVVAAPDQEASGSSAALTALAVDGRVLVRRAELTGLPSMPAYAVQAAPAFIAFTGVRGAFGVAPRVVVSGINLGPNTGRAILHSGTVGAALTAAGYGVPAAAFSLDWRAGTEVYWETAAAVAEEILPALAAQRPGVVLNVNIPNVPRTDLRGIRRGVLAANGAVEVNLVASGPDHLEVMMRETGDLPAEGSDAALVAAGFASVTPVLALCEQTSWPDSPWEGE
jgi:5'-nucleotidase